MPGCHAAAASEATELKVSWTALSRLMAARHRLEARKARIGMANGKSSDANARSN